MQRPMQRQSQLYTYGLGISLKHTSFWMTPDTQKWIKQTAQRLNISQGLLLHALITKHRLDNVPEPYRKQIANFNAHYKLVESIVNKA